MQFTTDSPRLTAPTLVAFLLAASGADAQTYFPVPPPCPVAGGSFGAAATMLDFDGDGHLDFAVGAPGQDAVFVFYGPAFTTWQAITSGGLLAPGVCPPGGSGTAFGSSLAGRGVDAFPGEELAIGAPGAYGGSGAAYVVGMQLAILEVSPALPQAHAGMGSSVALGDFDQDGRVDLAAGAPGTSVSGTCTGVSAEGRVHVFRHGFTTETLIDNPRAGRTGACNGNFGVALVVADTDSDGLDDLFVSSEANPVGAILNAGAIYRYGGLVIGPGGISAPLEIVDPNPLACDPGPRFSKSIDVRGNLLIAGGPRKDSVPSCAAVDIGGAFTFSGPSFVGTQLDPGAPTALLGFRVVLADFIGDATPDVIAFSLGTLKLYIWDGAALGAPPLELDGPLNGSGHWVQGVAAGQLISGGKEELLLGDPDFGGGAGLVRVLR